MKSITTDFEYKGSEHDGLPNGCSITAKVDPEVYGKITVNERLEIPFNGISRLYDLLIRLSRSISNGTSHHFPADDGSMAVISKGDGFVLISGMLRITITKQEAIDLYESCKFLCEKFMPKIKEQKHTLEYNIDLKTSDIWTAIAKNPEMLDAVTDEKTKKILEAIGRA